MISKVGKSERGKGLLLKTFQPGHAGRLALFFHRRRVDNTHGVAPSFSARFPETFLIPFLPFLPFPREETVGLQPERAAPKHGTDGKGSTPTQLLGKAEPRENPCPMTP